MGASQGRIARFRELVYRLRPTGPGPPRQLPLLLCHGMQGLTVETTVAHLDGKGAIWRILGARGEPAEVSSALERFMAYRATGLVEKQVLGRTRHGAILWYKYSARGTRGFSNTALAFRALGRDTVITDVARAGELEIRILSRAGKDLRAFLARVRRRAAPEFRVDLAYLGPPRSRGLSRLSTREEKLLAGALAAGYFEVPRRASAAQVGAGLGRSASAVSAALRRVTAKLARAHLGLA
ncbi:MAG: helix-turn-helix domain-containing protein [Euryarchaeota archaeon]|nr:helix-turn-helix domain-containing protein [Euryarchaeota archaeon]